MANLKVNNYHHLRLAINYEEYWDFYVNHDNIGSFDFGGKSLFDDCLISYIDLCDDECKDGEKWVYGKGSYTWYAANAVGHTMHDITYTGLDNGLVTYRKDRIRNSDFFDIFTGSTYDIEEGDYRLKLHAVSGNTLQYEYPIHFEDCQIKFNGGFLQGFFKTECDKYQVLPSKFNSGEVVHFEFELKKCDFEKESEKTLNDKYPDNKGMFFYIGTRAENKWVYMYDDDEGLDNCLELGVDDFVDDGELDKKDYIIGDFYDMEIDFEGYDPFELGDYTTYNYYDESLYDVPVEDDDTMDEFVDEDYAWWCEVEPASGMTIDEDAPHISLQLCCGEEIPEDITIPFWRGCGCPIVYKKKGHKPVVGLENCSAFGEDDYIGDFEDLWDLNKETDYIEPEMDISDFNYETYEGLELKFANQYYFYSDNKFLLFDRTKSGYTTRNWEEGTKAMFVGRNYKYKGNLFLLMNRTSTGYTTRNIEEMRDLWVDNTYNPYNDLYNNAFGLRIKDDGSIGYRMITVDCEKEGKDKTKVIEGYSNPGIIKDCEWTVVNVRLVFTFGKMRVYFYVDGKLVYSTGDLPQLNLRALKELPVKQEGVPFNISLGGGSQGLAETIQPNYMLNPWRVYPIEQNFAGSFIGYIRAFRMYDCSMEQGNVMNNWKFFRKTLA